jgi:hypothetical protein
MPDPGIDLMKNIVKKKTKKKRKKKREKIEFILKE